MKFNSGGYASDPTNSTIGVQFNDKFWSKAAVTEAKKVKTFSQLGDKLTQPRHFGDKIVKYHEIPILDDRNITDQGIDANGVTVLATIWYLYDSDGARVVTNADSDGNTGYSTKALALANQSAGDTITKGDGNLFGSSKDIAVQNGAFPALTEEGGMVRCLGLAA